MKFKNFFPYNFLLFSVIPLLLIYSSNVGEIPILDIRIPLAISIGLSGILFLCLRLKFTSTKAGLIISVFLISFILHGNLKSFLHESDILSNSFFENSLLFGSVFLIISLLSIYIIFKKNYSDDFNKIFTIFSITVILVLIPNILFFFVDENNFENQNFKIDLNHPLTQTPDIFIILLDEFAGEIQLSNDFDYSLKPFMINLNSMNFQVAQNSFSNYPNTAYSLPSILNMDYLEFIPDKIGIDSKNTLLAYDLRNDNNFMKILKNNDYKIVSFYGGMGSSGNASIVDEKPCSALNINNDLKEKFFQIYIPFTIFKNELINNPLSEKLSCIQNFVKNHEKNTVSELFFIHLRLPHHPYVYDSNGNYNAQSDFAEENKTAYLEQLKFTEKFTLELVSNIQKTDKDSYIVILSDHGYRGQINWKDQNLENLIRGHNVILAYYFPDNTPNLPKMTSLVNALRILINEISETKLEILHDKFYWYDHEKPNEHFDVTLIISEYLN